jgi:hypothetical protein
MDPMNENQGTRRAMVVGAHREGELLVVSARGALSRQGVHAAQAFTRGEFRRLDARAVVVDFSAALHPVGWDEGLRQAFLAPGCESICAPIAFVAAPHAYEFMRGVTWLLAAERGLVRGVFLSRADAMAWASDRREHWTHRPGLVLRSAAAG